MYEEHKSQELNSKAVFEFSIFNWKGISYYVSGNFCVLTIVIVIYSSN
jgi:hypothetical protein